MSNEIQSLAEKIITEKFLKLEHEIQLVYLDLFAVPRKLYHLELGELLPVLQYRIAKLRVVVKIRTIIWSCLVD